MVRRTLAILLCTVAAAGGATEVYDTRTGEMPSWVRPKTPDAASLQRDAERREAQRLDWLAASPIGARDYCATTAVVSQDTAAPAPEVLQCFHGNTSAEELRAHGWELTDVRRSLHKHSPGFEVEVVNSIAVKRRCVQERRGPAKGEPGCTELSKDGGLRPNLFWMPES